MISQGYNTSKLLQHIYRIVTAMRHSDSMTILFERYNGVVVLFLWDKGIITLLLPRVSVSGSIQG